MSSMRELDADPGVGGVGTSLRASWYRASPCTNYPAMVANVGRLAAQRRVLQGIAEDPVPVGKCAANVAKRALHAHNVRCRATGAWPSMRGYLAPATLPDDLVMQCPERRGGVPCTRATGTPSTGRSTRPCSPS